MRHLLTIIAGSVLFIAVYMTVYGKGLDFSLSSLSLGDTADKPSKTYIYPVNQIEPEDDAEFWIDTIMYAKGHAFGYSGDVSMWGGWYLDTVCVGTDNMLQYDSVGPAEGTEWEEPERDVKFELPDGSLTDSGVVFSFQPYEIDCWAAGAYHFIVPYKKLLPYMTPKARRLIDI